MLVAALDPLGSLASIAVARVESARVTRLQAFTASVEDDGSLPFPSTLLRATQPFLPGIQGVDVFLLGTAPGLHGAELQWSEAYREFVARLGKSLLLVDSLEACARHTLAELPYGTELVPVAGLMHGFGGEPGARCGGFRMNDEGRIETVLPVARRTQDELVAALSAMPRPRASSGQVWGTGSNKLERFGCGLGFELARDVLGGYLSALPDDSRLEAGATSAIHLLESFAAQRPLPAASVSSVSVSVSR